jgi:uncharacterized protein YecE (DUF72 family)
LKTFLALLPQTCKATFEFRHRSWFEEDIFALLSDHGCALCLADTDDEKLPGHLVATTDWGYLRLRRPDYDGPALQNWMDQIQEQPWQRAYVFFKHEDEGAGPRLARHFLDLSP